MVVFSAISCRALASLVIRSWFLLSVISIVDSDGLIRPYQGLSQVITDPSIRVIVWGRREVFVNVVAVNSYVTSIVSSVSTGSWFAWTVTLSASGLRNRGWLSSLDPKRKSSLRAPEAILHGVEITVMMSTKMIMGKEGFEIGNNLPRARSREVAGRDDRLRRQMLIGP